MRVAAFFLAALCLLLGGSPDASSAQTLDGANTTKIGSSWKAVGRLDVSDQGFCTAAIIDIDLVITAAHCVIDHHTDAPVSVSRLTFRAGLRQGIAAVTRQARSITIHPAFDYFSDEPTDRSAHDLALIQLAQPIRLPDIEPFATAVASLTAANVTLVSYDKDHADSPILQEGCRFVGVANEMLVTDCEADFGTSGAPVFQQVGSHLAIVSVVSAMGELDDGRRVTLGPDIAATLPAVIAASRAGTGALGRNPPPQVRVITPGERTHTGAKFIRP